MDSCLKLSIQTGHCCMFQFSYPHRQIFDSKVSFFIVLSSIRIPHTYTWQRDKFWFMCICIFITTQPPNHLIKQILRQPHWRVAWESVLWLWGISHWLLMECAKPLISACVMCYLAVIGTALPFSSCPTVNDGCFTECLTPKCVHIDPPYQMMRPAS